MKIYIIGSLRNPAIPEFANTLTKEGFEVFADWFAPGPEADDYWRNYSKARGWNYKQALQSSIAQNIFEFDKQHLDAADVVVMLMPAGKSGHLELGYHRGKGKPGYIFFPGGEDAFKELPKDWRWLAGLYEGEGCLTRNSRAKRNAHAMQLSITMRDKYIIEKALLVAQVGRLQGPIVRDNPKWSDMYRWMIHKKEDILYVLKGMWEYLGERRRKQVLKVLKEGLGYSEKDFHAYPNSPHEFRYDVMVQFATDIFFNQDELISELRRIDGQK